MVSKVDKINFYFKSRLNRLKILLENSSIQSIMILKDENIFYLTGFYGKDSKSILLLINDDIFLLVNFIYFEQAKKTIYDGKIEIIKYFKDGYHELLKILDNYDVKTIGVEGSNISHADFLKLEKELASQGKKIISVGNMVEDLRTVKDENEIARIKKACEITDKVFDSVTRLKDSDVIGLSEIELRYEIEKRLIKFGADGISFDPVVASGISSSMPHHTPTKNRIKKGILMMDFGCKYENYCSDMTRTIFLKNYEHNNEIKKIYDIVLRSQLEALNHCKEGITCAELDAVARNFIKSKGYGDSFGHGLGHGVGLEVHEKPALKPGSKFILKKNMIVTIEPAIYVSGFGGVRIEDMVLVKENCCEILYTAAKKFINL